MAIASRPQSTKLSDGERAKLVIRYFPPGRPRLYAMVVTLAENGSGDPRAINHNRDGSLDRGLWQINSRYHHEVMDSCAFSPACSTEAASRISLRGANWSQWSTWNHYHGLTGFPQTIRERAARALTENEVKLGPGPFDPGSIAKDVGGAALGIIKAPLTATQQIAKLIVLLMSAKLWIRIGMVLGGAVLLVLALKLLFGFSIPLPYGMKV